MRTHLAPLLALAACGTSPSPQLPSDTSAPASRPGLLVANKADSTLAILALPEGEVLATVPTGSGPHEIAVSPDGRRALVSNYGHQDPGSSITVVDLARRAVTATIDLEEHRRPHGMAFLPDGKRAVVTVEASRAVIIVDVDAGTVVRAIATDQDGSHMLALAPGGARAYVASIGSGSLTAIDLASLSAAEPVPVVPASEAIAVTPDGAEVWTASLKENVVVALDASLRELARVPAPGMPIRISALPDGSAMLVSNVQASAMQLIDVASRESTTIPLPPLPGIGPTAAPVGTAITADSRTAYVALVAEDRLAIIDLPSCTVTGHLHTGRGPDGLAYVAELPAAATVM